MQYSFLQGSAAQRCCFLYFSHSNMFCAFESNFAVA